MTTRWTPRRIAAGIVRRARRLTARTDVLGSQARKPAGHPEVSVILPIYNVEQYLAECLDSLVGQSHRDLEIVVVDDGSPDGSRRIAEEYASGDDRIRIVTRENGGLGAARNTGVAHATGEYLTFVDSDDKLPPRALAILLQSARRSGSDVVAGALQRFRSDRTWNPAWVEPLHAQARTGITIDDFPALVRNNYTCSKLFRRDFWTEQGLSFREGVSYEDQPLVTQLYIAAARIDVITDFVYLYRQREDASSISQQTASVKDLQDRISAWYLSRREFAGTASKPVYDAWLQTLFDAHFHWYLRSPGTADPAYWSALREAVVDLTEDAPESVWEATTPENRVPIALARRNRRDDVQEFVRREGNSPTRFPAKVVDGGVRHELPFHDDPDLDPALFVRRREQLVLSHSVHRLTWDDDATLRVSGWAYIRFVDLVGRDNTITLVLRNRRTGREHAVVATPCADPGYPPPYGDDWIDYSAGGFEAVVAMADAVGADRRDGDVWDVFLRVETVGLTVESPVRRVRRSSSAGVPGVGELADGDLLTVAWHLHAPLRLVLRRVEIEAVDVGLSGRTLRGRLTGPRAREVRAVELVGAGTPGARSEVDDGTFALDIPARGGDPGKPGTPRRGHVAAVLEAGDEVRLTRRGTGGIDDVQLLDRTALAVERTRVSELAVVEWRAAAYADAVEVSPDGRARITGHVYAPDAVTVAVRLSSNKTQIASAAASVDRTRFEAVVDLSYDAYRFGRLPLPWGNYEMTAVISVAGSEEKLTAPLLVSSDLNDCLPLRTQTDEVEGRIERGVRNMVRLALVRPLGDAAGKCRQNRLRVASGTRLTTGMRRGLLIRAYFGEAATDSGLGVQRELQRRGADIDIYWSVQDHSIPVPDGATPVIQNSYEWYGLLNNVRYYMDNMYQPAYHEKPDGQVIIQTLHGYPFKTMGHQHWEHRQFSRAQIERSEGRRVGT